ncbi:cell division protein FtsZ [Schleiferiaceae bacterium]|jgi:cell division protein FtsZ|nr:cell division protein FtsZ [Schleiferiaceae bacterium]
MIEDGIQFNLPKNRSSVIKVIGVGGGGSNAVNHMKNVGVNGVDFIICNTDAQALYHSPVANKVQLGASLTEGLGAGADPEIGRSAAEESIQEIQNILETGTKMCFITAGMGGGTGTGAAPIIAKAAREMGILTVGIVTAPFSFEGKIRAAQAEEGVKAMRDAVDSLIVINNDKLRQVYGDLGFRNAFSKADEVLAGAAKGIAEVITNHYTQNIDLRDAKTVLENSGSALFGTGEGEGTGRAAKAVGAALDSPLLNDNHIKGAKNVLLLLTSGDGDHEVTIDEIGEITDHIQREAGGNANVIMGIGSSEETGSRITCTIIATGFPTGTQVLPSDKPELVKYNLEGNDSQGAADAAPAPLEASVVTEQKERVVMDLEDVAPENQAPTFETNEVVEDIEDAVNTTTETEGFPQQPDEDIEATFEGALENEGLEIEEDETPMVHVLEWDMEDESDEATEAIEQAVDESHIDSETVDEGDSPTLAGGWDLFTQDELVEEEMELTFVDEDEAEEILSEEDEAIGSYSEDVFDAEAPPKMERLELEKTEAPSEEVATAADASSENVQSIGEERRFTLEDIEGDGFTLEIEELETPQESSPSNDSIEDTQYDPFDLSLSDMPELKQKAEQESMESSFTLVSKEFELEPQAGLPMTETDTLEEADPALHFQIKESDAPAAKGAPEEEETFDMDQPLSEMPRRPLSDLPSKIQDRMSRLQSFQYQFKANLQNLSDAERVPAYLRQGMEVDLDQKSNEQPSNIGVDNDGNIRTNNSFLHDNVD